MSGSPDVSIDIVSGLVPLQDANYLMMFMSGWTKYSLEHDYSKDQLACAVAGVNQMIAFYQKNKSQLGKNPLMNKLIKKQKKGDLEEYVASRFS